MLFRSDSGSHAGSSTSAGSSTNASGNAGGDLPRTGADGLPALAGFAALLLAGGAAAVWATRRYRAGKH